MEARVSAAEAAALEAEQAHGQTVHRHEAEYRELAARLAKSDESRRELEDRHAAEVAELRSELDAQMAEEGEVHLRELERLGVKLRESEEALREAERAQTDLEEAHSDHRAELERMRAQLHRSEAALADQRAETQRVLEQAALDADAYDERIAEIQRQLEKFETAARTATERMVAATSGGKQDSAGRVELNTITVEGLRQLGLSITQAARLVHHREARGGFRSTADLDDVPGLPAEHRADLANRVYVDESLAGL